MKIAILGTRGIPNQYGGFEQMAMYLSSGLRARGHEVYVYCSKAHVYREKTWKGINLIHKYDPEKKVGTAGQFIYDLYCIADSRKRNFDVILNLGYTSSAIWMGLFKKSARIVTNMDGLEWKRTKYSRLVQLFLKYSERLAVSKSDTLVADSRAIQQYLKDKYSVQSHFVAYGAEIVTRAEVQILDNFDIRPAGYDLLIARMEPENNIEIILQGKMRSSDRAPIVVVGNTANRYGTKLRALFKNEPRIKFTGPVYDQASVDSLRFYSRLYFHGHSVGGTNPSLLEAMGSGCVIAAHDNIFNRSVLSGDALYFSQAEDVAAIMDRAVTSGLDEMRSVNRDKIRTSYSWPFIVSEYEKILAES